MFRGQNGPTQIAAFGSPIVALATDSAGRIYVASTPPEFPVGGGLGQISVVAPAGVSALPPQPTTTPNPTSAAPTHFANIATRAFVGNGSSIAIAGFVISGAASEQVLIRGIGPSLAQFAVTGVLAQPVLTLFNAAGAPVATNTSWGANTTTTAAQFSAVFTKVGAFALPQGSADSALLVTLAPGSYSAQLSGVNGGTGTGLIEVYEVPVP